MAETARGQPRLPCPDCSLQRDVPLLLGLLSVPGRLRLLPGDERSLVQRPVLEVQVVLEHSRILVARVTLQDGAVRVRRQTGEESMGGRVANDLFAVGIRLEAHSLAQAPMRSASASLVQGRPSSFRNTNGCCSSRRVHRLRSRASTGGMRGMSRAFGLSRNARIGVAGGLDGLASVPGSRHFTGNGTGTEHRPFSLLR